MKQQWTKIDKDNYEMIFDNDNTLYLQRDRVQQGYGMGGQAVSWSASVTNNINDNEEHLDMRAANNRTDKNHPNHVACGVTEAKKIALAEYSCSRSARITATDVVSHKLQKVIDQIQRCHDLRINPPKSAIVELEVLQIKIKRLLQGK